MPAAPGTMLSPTIRLVRPLGAGGMGAVWIADHLALRTQVVVKLLADGLASSPTALARFSHEAAAASQVKSPHVVQMLDYGVAQDGTPFIVMELLEGHDLSGELRRTGPMPLQRFAVLFEQMASALARAHERGVIHRDIKPENIFLCDVGQREWFVKVLDFGIAKGTDGPQDGAHTRTGATVGTPYYMSPEQLEGARDLDSRTDLWALGVVAFEALTGQRPFPGETYFSIAIAINNGPKVGPSQINPALPPAIDAWYFRACARDRAQRFATANEMAQALTAIAATPVTNAQTQVSSGGGWNGMWSYQPTAAQTPAFTPPTAQSGAPAADTRPSPGAAPIGTHTNGALIASAAQASPKTKSSLPMILGIVAGLMALGVGGTAIALLVVVPRLQPAANKKSPTAETGASASAPPSASAVTSSAPLALDEIHFGKRDYVVGATYDEEQVLDNRLNFIAPQKGYGGTLGREKKKVEIAAMDGKAITRLKVTYFEHAFTATRLDGTQLQQVTPLNGKTYVIEADAQHGITFVRDDHDSMAPAIEDQAVRAEWSTLGRPDPLIAAVPETPMKRGDESPAFADVVKRMLTTGSTETPQFEGARAVLKDIVAEGKDVVGVFDFSGKQTNTQQGETLAIDWGGTFTIRAADSRLIRCDLQGPQRASGRIDGNGTSELKITHTDH